MQTQCLQSLINRHHCINSKKFHFFELLDLYQSLVFYKISNQFNLNDQHEIYVRVIV